ncbi:hypothetical protein HN419_01170 [Candidatus Woesearchaeota archaeon]|jgi:hypothetical protein|nr:hypothetical protein [Candidatus Woesearchaeota archaeon]MBT3537393.1 hypothetical protein [Candidatus Woesearchaeota archaeon]MBT4697082.1 hypothetical protein [Candidatus Woesearchaeota archaeon]MBT4717599.1 hypothetical protein [Candidatus Woesearchaeota archaeon]MBT7106297.1 hypothetical protein [Candidatus Woesearchaeota archaeon]
MKILEQKGEVTIDDFLAGVRGVVDKINADVREGTPIEEGAEYLAKRLAEVKGDGEYTVMHTQLAGPDQTGILAKHGFDVVIAKDGEKYLSISYLCDDAPAAHGAFEIRVETANKIMTNNNFRVAGSSQPAGVRLTSKQENPMGDPVLESMVYFHLNRPHLDEQAKAIAKQGTSVVLLTPATALGFMQNGLNMFYEQ